MHALIRRCVPYLALVVLALTLSGCGSYMLQGKVVRGDVSGIQLVYPNDERLQAAAVASVDVRLTRDPTTPNRRMLGHARSDAKGEFTIIMSEFGTGWMQEKWLVQGVAPGFNNAQSMMELPSKNSKWRLLITLAEGVSDPLQDENLMEDLERFK
jgi:hypothetical protein